MRLSQKNESDFAAYLRGQGFAVQQLGKYDAIDFLVERDGKQGLIEYKRRFIHSETYETTIFPAKKLAACLSIARACRLPFYYFCEFDDCLAMTEPENYPLTISYGGRQDRGLEERGLYVEMHMRNFRRIYLRPNGDKGNGQILANRY